MKTYRFENLNYQYSWQDTNIISIFQQYYIRYRFQILTEFHMYISSCEKKWFNLLSKFVAYDLYLQQ